MVPADEPPLGAPTPHLTMSHYVPTALEMATASTPPIVVPVSARGFEAVLPGARASKRVRLRAACLLRREVLAVPRLAGQRLRPGLQLEARPLTAELRAA
eukprot:CAMPEP_0176130886 /NCGR_PEP_ID=MMETSP0120_2-20121206/66239_1 /TAXON_ID=160619 /ORGANISM="Kryptoperidinium foliaceum, Strain CCMP 1326" /LENGTH=99 /DNA_ID=CAMNT_0017466211 /DNA_START=38 /DNA_END=334 /DNA_ORIENTATION=+